LYIIRPLIALVLAQIIKIIIESLRQKRFDFKRIMGTGGMPSSHAAITVALTTQIGKNLGVETPIFAVALVFTLVILYDAAGIRRAAGKQAVVLNKILDEIIVNKKVPDSRLKELLGHTPIEVVIGGLLGFFVGWI